MSRFGNEPTLEELFGMLQQNTPPKEEKRKDAHTPSEISWRALIYQGNVLVLDHAQNDYGKVFRFVMNGLAELHNGGADDYRVTIQDRQGNLFFFACGPKTQMSRYKKAGDK